MGGHRISPPTTDHRPSGLAPTDRLARARAFRQAQDEEHAVKKAEEVMGILEAFDLAGTLRGAADGGVSKPAP